MTETRNNHPIAFIHGILGWGPEEAGFGPYWGRAHDLQARYPGRIKFASVGPVSSHWDRARELFYQIKGGDCDYGAEHSKAFKHKYRILEDWQKGKQPLYRTWDASNPIHFVGHSQGAPTVRMLQYMLAENLFEGHQTSSDWIRSITTISGVNNGSTLAYASLDSEDGRFPRPSVFTLVKLLFETIWHTIPELGFVKTLLSNIPKHDRDYNWDLDLWGLKRRFFEPFPFFLIRILRHSFLYGKDNAAYDLSLHAMADWNAVLKDYPSTYYFSYMTRQTKPSNAADSSSPQIPEDGLNPLLKRFARQMGSFKEAILPNFVPEDWWPNDGAVSTVSQKQPWLGRREPVCHKTIVNSDWPSEVVPKCWFVMPDTLDGWDHLDIVMFPESESQRQKQIEFYDALCQHLWQLPPVSLENSAEGGQVNRGQATAI